MQGQRSVLGAMMDGGGDDAAYCGLESVAEMEGRVMLAGSGCVDSEVVWEW